MGVVSEAIALLQLRAAGGMAFAMADAKILAHKGPVAIGEITAKDLFRGVCKEREVSVARVEYRRDGIRFN